MRIVKAVTLALASLSLLTAGCASSSDGEGSASAPSDTAPKKTFSAPLPSASAGSDDSPTAATDEPPPSPDADAPGSSDSPDAPATPATPGAPAGPATPGAPANPGPKPTNACSVSKDSLGFFNRTSSKSDYVAFVPASYSPSKPMRLVVGLHGCGDNALNFAKWAVSPWDTRATQTHIGISISGETGGSKCWSMGADDDKVLAAVDDIAKCFWIDRSKVVIAGYSSGGELAYRVGLKHADKFAGILIENAAAYDVGEAPSQLVAEASWKLPIAHSAHTGDTVFPIAKVKADWAVIRAAGFSLTTQEVAGTHEGDGKEWASWLIPHSANWTR